MQKLISHRVISMHSEKLSLNFMIPFQAIQAIGLKIIFFSHPKARQSRYDVLRVQELRRRSSFFCLALNAKIGLE